MAKKRLNILLQDELLIGSPETHSLCWLPPVSLGKAEADESGRYGILSTPRNLSPSSVRGF